LQGELIGPGIQGNKYNVNQHVYAVYDIFDIDQQMYLLPKERQDICTDLRIFHVPVLNEISLEHFDVEQILVQCQFKSTLNDKAEAEGFVFKSMRDDFSFKAISNKWLLKHE
jgi:ATP-dependent RNA circularization protein (DNA/RNA ligase family)